MAVQLMTNMKETGNFSVECDDQVIVTHSKNRKRRKLMKIKTRTGKKGVNAKNIKYHNQ